MKMWKRLGHYFPETPPLFAHWLITTSWKFQGKGKCAAFPTNKQKQNWIRYRRWMFRKYLLHLLSLCDTGRIEAVVVTTVTPKNDISCCLLFCQHKPNVSWTRVAALLFSLVTEEDILIRFSDDLIKLWPSIIQILSSVENNRVLVSV